MADKILIGNKWYVAATSARNEQSPQVLKNDETFVMFDHFGDLQVHGVGDEGLYHEDTRYLAYQELTIDGVRPLFLGSSIKDNNSLLIIELMNPDLTRDERVQVAKGTVHILRAKLLWRGACYEHVRVTNHGRETFEADVSIHFAADFTDLFEVRGMSRPRRGERLESVVEASAVQLRYRGLDGQSRTTRLRFEPEPSMLDEREARFCIRLQPGHEVHLYCTVSCEREGAAPDPAGAGNYDQALRLAQAERGRMAAMRCQIETSNPLVNLWLDRSFSDLTMLTTTLTSGPYPYAGVPWYSTTFGRDGILTARAMLWTDPTIARGVLGFLAATQATERDPERDAEPGKILHEARRCEMAATREIPFGRYYGSVDSTPLFVALAGAYYQRTGDLAFIRSIWPHVIAALEWIDRDGDIDRDGFVEYARRSREGLVQQGWKDSQDSVFHADGTLAQAPIALCEVQGYVYEAKLLAAELAHHLGDEPLATRLRFAAEDLKRNFVQQFWCDDLGSYAIALDGAKQPCRVAASNAGHALWSGIATPQHARQIVDLLMSERFFSGWGIRTIARGEPRYNPMSYHNGSIWPHDNAIIAAGMARYGHTKEAMRILGAMFDSSLYFEHYRLPELFCGFPRRPGEGPTLYPVACSPQAWAAAAVFGVLQSCLGLNFEPVKPKVAMTAPHLPEFIQWMRISRLNVREHSLDVMLQRYRNNVGVEVTQRSGALDVVIELQ
ncbi:MAG TPA: amylo-alpha-1,6-glucosidase [Burkholderiaceae bacterium]